MKKKIGVLLIILFSVVVRNVKAESFYIGNYISGEYITMERGSYKKYLTLQYLNTEDGGIVYCLEPFELLESDENYIEYKNNMAKMVNLSEEQFRRVELLAYYGYGYEGRTSSKWYTVTQYMIWKTVAPDAKIYFTYLLNGREIEKYVTEMEEIERDVSNHEQQLGIEGKTFEVGYGNNLELKELNNNYFIQSGYEYDNAKTLLIKNVKNDDKLMFRKISKYYNRDVSVFVSGDSQNVIRPGNVLNSTYELFVKVLKGKIRLNIYEDNSIYSSGKDFSNTCYLIYNDNYENKVCVNKETSYITDDLPYGKYYIKQISNGEGYLEDNKIYEVEVKSKDVVEIDLYNELIKGQLKILKRYCDEGVCYLEKDAEFGLFDDDIFVGNIVTNKYGVGNISIGYGSYIVKQLVSKDGYDYVDSIEIFILEDGQVISKEFDDKKIVLEEVDNEKEEPSIEEVKIELDDVCVPQVIDEKIEVEENIPETGVNDSYFIYYILLVLGLIPIKKLLFKE